MRLRNKYVDSSPINDDRNVRNKVTAGSNSVLRHYNGVCVIQQVYKLVSNELMSNSAHVQQLRNRVCKHQRPFKKSQFEGREFSQRGLRAVRTTNVQSSRTKPTQGDKLLLGSEQGHILARWLHGSSQLLLQEQQPRSGLPKSTNTAPNCQVIWLWTRWLSAPSQRSLGSWSRPLICNGSYLSQGQGQGQLTTRATRSSFTSKWYCSQGYVYLPLTVTAPLYPEFKLKRYPTVCMQ